MSAELEHIWLRVQADLAGAVDEPTYRIWLEPLRARELSEGRLSIEAPAQTCGWVQDRFGRVLQACVEGVLGAAVSIEVIPGAADTARHGGVSAKRGPGGAHMARGELPSREHRHSAADGLRGERGASGSGGEPPAQAQAGLMGGLGAGGAGAINPKLTFDQFVIGDCNRLAHAAALTVAEMPAQAYNPLFACGPPGVGKTHLLSAIAHLLLAHNPGLAVRMTTGEAFTNEFLQALAGGRTETFKAKFRHVDVLLVDDVQFLERKTRTEEEFFHTFNALHDGGRQIVLSSDRPPRDLQALEDRLRERFESGLVADMKPPDIATRMAILRKRAQHDELDPIGDATLAPIAERITDNVRTLEGALIRVVAYGSLTKRALTPELAQEVLDGLYPQSPTQAPGAQPSISDIKAATCAHFGVSTEELLSPSRASRVTWPRQVAMYLARELTEESLPAIGRQFGGRDHTTVLHAHRRAATRIAGDASLNQTVHNLIEKLAGERVDTPRRDHDRPA